MGWEWWCGWWMAYTLALTEMLVISFNTHLHIYIIIYISSESVNRMSRLKEAEYIWDIPSKIIFHTWQYLSNSFPVYFIYKKLTKIQNTFFLHL